MLALETLPYLYRASLLGWVRASVRDSCFWICGTHLVQLQAREAELVSSGTRGQWEKCGVHEHCNSKARQGKNCVHRCRLCRIQDNVKAETRSMHMPSKHAGACLIYDAAATSVDAEVLEGGLEVGHVWLDLHAQGLPQQQSQQTVASAIKDHW